MVKQYVEGIRAAGVDHAFVSSDTGQINSVFQPDALAKCAKVLRANGFTEQELAKLFKINPAKILGLTPPPGRSADSGLPWCRPEATTSCYERGAAMQRVTMTTLGLVAFAAVLAPSAAFCAGAERGDDRQRRRNPDGRPPWAAIGKSRFSTWASSTSASRCFAVERSKPGGPMNVINHAKLTEVYYVTSGEGTIVTGSDIENVRPLAADNELVTTVVGPGDNATLKKPAQSRKVKAGDVIIIPAGVYHGFSEVPDHIEYVLDPAGCGESAAGRLREPGGEEVVQAFRPAGEPLCRSHVA